ncbi:MAG: MFS transporter [Pseudomonadota bacterium]
MTDSDQPVEDENDLEIDAELSERNPVSGLSTALDAGTSFMFTARSLFAHKVRRGVTWELPAYLLIQSSWFMAFGLQLVLFPYLITNKLGLGGLELGLANLALSAPSVVFLLLGGVVAERMAGKPLLMILHVMAGVPALGLAIAVATGHLTYGLMIAYGILLGTVGAFMLPTRDAALNEVVERRMRIGKGITLQQGVAFATLAQFAAQILGLILAGYADKATTMPGFLGGFKIGPIDSYRLLFTQSIVVSLGALFAIWLGRGRKVKTGRSGLSAAFGDIADGYRAVRADAKLWNMTLLMFGVGVFVIGSFLVVLPIINRDVYGLESDGLRDTYVTFWFGAFVSSVALSFLKNIKRPGQLLLLAQLIGSSIIILIAFEIPHEGFLGIVFGWGLAAGISIAMSRSIVQDAAPKDQLARVLSIYSLGFMAGAPVGAAFMGALTDWFGPLKIAFVPAAGMAILIGWMIFRTPIWSMRADDK